MTTEQPLFYREESPESGATFVIDGLRRVTNSFRVHMRVLNTGEQGRITLRFEVNFAYVMTEERAAQWRAEYPMAYAMGTAGQDMDVASYQGVMLVPTAGTILPASLDKGEEWDGWFESVRRTLPLDASAMLMVFGPIVTQATPRGLIHRTMNATRPYVSLRGDVTVEPLAGSELLKQRWDATLQSYLRDLTQLDTLMAIPGALVAALLGSMISFEAALIAVFPGVVLGGIAGRLMRWYLDSRRKAVS